ncbi:unnamed protein product [Closterium sp. Yama58-4]|nr:unnamed protein product [Closterium sp. Yama58-4]
MPFSLAGTELTVQSVLLVSDSDEEGDEGQQGNQQRRRERRRRKAQGEDAGSAEITNPERQAELHGRKNHAEGAGDGQRRGPLDSSREGGELARSYSVDSVDSVDSLDRDGSICSPRSVDSLDLASPRSVDSAEPHDSANLPVSAHPAAKRKSKARHRRKGSRGSSRLSRSVCATSADGRVAPADADVAASTSANGHVTAAALAAAHARSAGELSLGEDGALRERRSMGGGMGMGGLGESGGGMGMGGLGELGGGMGMGGLGELGGGMGMGGLGELGGGMGMGGLGELGGGMGMGGLGELGGGMGMGGLGELGGGMGMGGLGELGGGMGMGGLGELGGGMGMGGLGELGGGMGMGGLGELGGGMGMGGLGELGGGMGMGGLGELGGGMGMGGLGELGGGMGMGGLGELGGGMGRGRGGVASAGAAVPPVKLPGPGGGRMGIGGKIGGSGGNETGGGIGGSMGAPWVVLGSREITEAASVAPFHTSGAAMATAEAASEAAAEAAASLQPGSPVRLQRVLAAVSRALDRASEEAAAGREGPSGVEVNGESTQNTPDVSRALDKASEEAAAGREGSAEATSDAAVGMREAHAETPEREEAALGNTDEEGEWGAGSEVRMRAVHVRAVHVRAVHVRVVHVRAVHVRGVQVRGGISIEFHVIRHGESTQSPALIAGRSPAAHLTPTGVQQAVSLGTFLRRYLRLQWDEVFCSPIPRATHTARLVCQELGFPTSRIQEAAELQEMSAGHWEGKPRAEFFSSDAALAWMTASQPDFCYPGGESQRQVEYRMVSFLNRLATNHATRLMSTKSSASAQEEGGKSTAKCHIGIFSHCASIKCLLRGLMGSSPHMTHKIVVDHTSSTVAFSPATGWRLVRVNDVSHLLVAQGPIAP